MAGTRPGHDQLSMKRRWPMEYLNTDNSVNRLEIVGHCRSAVEFHNDTFEICQRLVVKFGWQLRRDRYQRLPLWQSLSLSCPYHTVHP